MWELAGPNLYVYASLNPTGQIDYYGLWPFGMPGRSEAEKNAPSWVDHYVPDLTDQERDKLVRDALDKFGWKDANKARTTFDSAADPPEDLSKLTDEQKEFIRDFLRKIQDGNESAVKKCEGALSGQPSQPAPPTPAP